MNLSKSGSQQALAPAERYETCPMCSTCVVESRLICQACVRMGNFTAIRDDVTFAQLQPCKRADLTESQSRVADGGGRQPFVVTVCQLRPVAPLREPPPLEAASARPVRRTRGRRRAERSRRSAARQACAALSREVEAYRRKTADLTAGLNSLRDRYNAGRARAERARHGAAKKARSVCRLIATEVYNLHETERSIVHHRLRLPPLSSFPSRSLEPAPETYQALLAASSLLQALTACLATWTPFQPVPITFMRSPLSRDSVNAQHAKLQVALHSLCNRYHHCLALYAPGDHC
uniref:Beclin 1-associated autophagy-related key regulator n=1 Tax=Macrostomum lignano TaxID=282301 RepID=A0A1I8FSW9_9PLAT